MRNLTTNNRARRVPASWDFFSRFDDFFNDFERDLLGSSDRSLSQLQGRGMIEEFSPAVDIEESEDMYMISADLPGMKEEDVKINVNDRTLRISGERNRETKDEDKGYFERSCGRFTRSFTLPEAVDSKKIEAHFSDGVLRILLPKTEVKSAQEVKIQSGKPQGLIERFLHREKEVPSSSSAASKSATDKNMRN